MKKTMMMAVAALGLVSFSGKDAETVNGLWTGVYKVDEERSRVVVRFEDEQQFALYNEVVDDEHRMMGSYKLQGDTAVVFTYKTAAGKQCTMTGKLNERKTFVDGVWENCDQARGSFYLKKEKIEELFIAP